MSFTHTPLSFSKRSKIENVDQNLGTRITILMIFQTHQSTMKLVSLMDILDLDNFTFRSTCKHTTTNIRSMLPRLYSVTWFLFASAWPKSEKSRCTFNIGTEVGKTERKVYAWISYSAVTSVFTHDKLTHQIFPSVSDNSNNIFAHRQLRLPLSSTARVIMIFYISIDGSWQTPLITVTTTVYSLLPPRSPSLHYS